MKIYEREYDNPHLHPEPKLLGNFKIIETVKNEMYSSLRIGEKDGKKFIIQESEVSGRSGGSRFEIFELKKLK